MCISKHDCPQDGPAFLLPVTGPQKTRRGGGRFLHHHFHNIEKSCFAWLPFGTYIPCFSRYLLTSISLSCCLLSHKSAGVEPLHLLSSQNMPLLTLFLLWSIGLFFQMVITLVASSISPLLLHSGEDCHELQQIQIQDKLTSFF